MNNATSQRTIKINDKKKLYYIEPFSKQEEEVIDEDAKPVAVKSKPAPADKTKEKTGGVVYMYQSITDTGERKKCMVSPPGMCGVRKK